ncbi:helix-hairpin-helix domain-containing protein [Salipiger abyssi]|uniref:Helix-hairpin-helix domain-containing protein n=1 Tax=Salipiger abyssi TaxID=1250539 RepID=A0A1P8UZ86_9RHOB|nr:helix-hairpin-helix domain-containing protein [Salipiger abyssi]APZ54700.1 Helix-hairpin-helix domain-containing protein [Salipiger abyssi]
MTDLTSIRGVGPVLAMKMREMGIESPADLASAAPESLTSLPRVQLLRARMLISAAEEILRGMEEASEADAPAEETVPDEVAQTSAPEAAAVTEMAPTRKKDKPKGKKAKKKKAKSDKPKKKGKDKKATARAAKKAAKAEKKSVKGKKSKGGKKKKKSGK